MTWEPPWGYGNVTVIGHEMGHGFGLPHSGGPNSSGVLQEYNNAWDVMGNAWAFCALATDPSYGCLGQHTIADYKSRLLGWIVGTRKYTAMPGSQATIVLERLTQPPVENYLLAQVPIGGSATRYYTVESRRRVGYDVKTGGDAVVIHEVDTARSVDAMVLDADLDGDTGDAGAMWTVGETFSDTPNGVLVCVKAATSTGFVVTIGLGMPSACSAPSSSPYNVYVPFMNR
jgi:hypothetical protein